MQNKEFYSTIHYKIDKDDQHMLFLFMPLLKNNFINAHDVKVERYLSQNEKTFWHNVHFYNGFESELFKQIQAWLCKTDLE